MKVLKFGGTSVGSIKSMRYILEILKDHYKKDTDLWVVVSALGGTTNQLIQLGEMARGGAPYRQLLNEIENRHLEMTKGLLTGGQQALLLEVIHGKLSELDKILYGVSLLKEFSRKTRDLVMSFGEVLSALLLTTLLQEENLPATFLDARRMILSNSQFGFAKINRKETRNRVDAYRKNHSGIQIVTGFIAADVEGITTTLGRGASDLTASLLANFLDADCVEIWSDVNGMMTADPRKVSKAFTIKELSYEEAMELSHFGTKVLYPPTIQPAREKQIPIYLKNTFHATGAYTIIKGIDQRGDLNTGITGITSISNVSLIHLQGTGMVGVTGIAGRLFSALSEGGINIIMITQGSSEHSIGIVVLPEDALRAKELIEKGFSLELEAKRIEPVSIEEGCSVIAIVGENMRHKLGIAGNLFSALGHNGINVRAIAQGSSELNISLVVQGRDEWKALNAIHESFFLFDQRQLNLFIVGTGLIGATLLKQIKKDYAKHSPSKFRFNLVGVANSRKMFFDPEGIDLNQWEDKLDSGEVSDLDQFVKRIDQLNLPYSIFVDATANGKIIDYYPDILKQSVSIVTPNKVANVAPMSYYNRVRDLAKRYQAHYFYETTVGAGLPVISTLRDLLDSGDLIEKIEGVFSGTLSFIFNAFTEGKKFSDVVKDAMAMGYTEPDPRLDLNGADIARKILILIRETGISIDFDDVRVERILPDDAFDPSNSVDQFLEKLVGYDDYFEKIRSEAAADGCRLRYVASYENGVASIALKRANVSDPTYSLEGSDNIISFNTRRYQQTPMVIKGSGAGAEVTAAGVLADLIRTAKLVLKD